MSPDEEGLDAGGGPPISELIATLAIGIGLTFVVLWLFSGQTTQLLGIYSGSI